MKQMKHAMKPLTGLAVLLSLLALGACGEKPQQQQAAAPAESQVEKETIVWKLAQTWGTGFPIFGDAVIKMADMVKEMSGGELEIRIDSSNKHKAAFGILDMVNAGQYQMGHSASYYWKGKEPSAMFFTTMPFGMIAPEQYAWFYYGGGMELMQRVYDKHGVYSFPGGNTGNQMGGWFRKEINTLDDLQGLRALPERSCRSWVSSSRTSLRASSIRHSIAAPSTRWSGSGLPWTSTWVSRRLHLTTTRAGTSRRRSCSSW
jgi:TRAP-type C4-dicarboxylate transport system substrate-binding protein